MPATLTARVRSSGHLLPGTLAARDTAGMECQRNLLPEPGEAGVLRGAKRTCDALQLFRAQCLCRAAEQSRLQALEEMPTRGCGEV